MTANKQTTQDQNNTQNIFNIQPAVVKKWVSDLPLGSTGESSKLLYHALKQVNNQANSLDHHLEFLEILTPTLASLYPILNYKICNRIFR